MKKKKKGIIIVAIIVVVLLVVIKLVSCAMSMEQGALVTTTSAERGNLQESISTNGTVVSGETKVIFSMVSGKVLQVEAEPGDAVAAGDMLISYDMEQMDRRLRQAALEQAGSRAGYLGAVADNSESQADLNEANINLDVLNRQIADNEAYLKKLQDQLKKSQRETGNDLAEDAYLLNQKLSELQIKLEGETTVSGGDDPAGLTEEGKKIQEEINDVKAQISRNSYLQGIAGSSDYVAEMEAEIADVQERIADYKEYKAEMESQKNTSENVVWDAYDKEQKDADYELAKLSYEEAEEAYYLAKQGVRADFNGIITECTAVCGATVAEGTQLLKLESSDNVKVTFNASKYDIEKLKEGQKVDVTIMGNDYEGQISKINRMATLNDSKTPMVGVEVQILNPDDKIILGLDAKLTVYTRKCENALTIPVEAVNADKEGDFLYVIEDGKAVRRPIVCGITSDSYVEVVEGISEEDQIILTSFTALEDGMAVNVMPQ
ncbi:MAG: efflux RND transporter periplasmic adaptor subunit [Lachnospiraceae bacterium]|nr:efflux RND transporter periplasmic adaptor subunit [Lachnospiraceae bacterium]